MNVQYVYEKGTDPQCASNVPFSYLIFTLFY